ncbi:TPA: SurA N-terminal domain-containing protein, partial [Neisseria meningitidis]
MFHSIEKYRTPAQVLLGLIALTFVGFGVSTVSHPGADYIVQVGDEKISDHSINNAIQNEQADGGGPSRDAVFQSLLQRAYLKQGAKLMGISVSSEQIKQIIVDDPNFHDANGKFDHALLNRYLSQRHMSEDQFVEEIRDQFALQNLVNLVQNGVLVGDAQAEQLIRLTQVNRTIRSHTFNPDEFIAQVKVSEADLQKFYNANKKDYLLPQAVKLEYVALNLKDFADKQTVSETEVKNAFEERVARLPANEAKPSFEQEKAAVENELKMKKAVADFNKAKEKLGDDAFNHPSSLAEAAKNSGLKVETQETWLSRQDAQMSGMPENLINAVFSDDVLKKKHNSE